MNLFQNAKPISVKIFLIFASLEVIQSIAISYFGFDKSVSELQMTLSEHISLPDFLHPILYSLYIGMNTLFDATQMYYIVLLRNNPMRLFYLLSNIFVFYGFFFDTNKIMKIFNTTSSQEFINGTLGLIALICALVTSICLTNKDLVHWMRRNDN